MATQLKQYGTDTLSQGNIKNNFLNSSSANEQYNLRNEISTPANIFDKDGTGNSGTDQCNESLKHSNMEKSVFHGMKSAKRLKDEELHMQAVRVAGEVARGFLLSEDIDYVPEKSEKHLLEEIKEKILGGDHFDEINKGIEKAWNKINRGHHKGGARVAIAVADEYLDDFDTSDVEENQGRI